MEGEVGVSLSDLVTVASLLPGTTFRDEKCLGPPRGSRRLYNSVPAAAQPLPAPRLVPFTLSPPGPPAPLCGMLALPPAPPLALSQSISHTTVTMVFPEQSQPRPSATSNPPLTLDSATSQFLLPESDELEASFRRDSAFRNDQSSPGSPPGNC
uniref:Uncharacterized protein n=1 Tax=Rousettus aegyptiacus TaxID=9407 RepID=A0A7J8DXV0_ROUAE|nr:hypothetical protein HJG63_008433 [Rousettus aegyptiacus]